MKLEWLNPQGTEIAHCCATEGDNIWPICGYKLLTPVFTPDDDTKVCLQCASKVQSGDEIKILIGSNQEMVVRPKLPPAYQGSLDPFQDIVEILQGMGVMYTLIIGIPKQRNLRYWTNLARFGNGAVDLFEGDVKKIVEIVREKISGGTS